jgi:hypothetical protein
MQAATVELLVEKAHFEQGTAMAVAEAIDMAIHSEQLVTVPILEASLEKVRSEVAGVKAELVRWVFLVMLGNVALTAGATALLNAVQRVH